MRYIHVTWNHESLDDPIELYSELDDESWEVRKLEVFRNGRIGYADAFDSTESTRLGIEPVPRLDQIALDPEFHLKVIDRAEFERLWNSAHFVMRRE
jgi:hypothetical protein